MNNIPSTSPSFGARMDFARGLSKETINEMSELITKDVEAAGIKRFQKVGDAFEKTHPEDIVELKPMPMGLNMSNLLCVAGNKMSRFLQFTNQRTGKGVTLYVDNFCDTVANLTKNYDKFFEGK